MQEVVHEDTAEVDVERDISTEKKFEVEISKGEETVDKELRRLEMDAPVEQDALLEDMKKEISSL